MYTFYTNNEEETKRLGQTLAKYLNAGDVLTLDGDLGAGKTTFTKGLAEGLGVKRTVNSPTFTIIKEYQGDELPLYHMDVYRLEGSNEDIGFEEYFDGEGVSVVEWSKIIEEYLPKERLNITIERLDENKRKVTLAPTSDRFKTICEEFRK